MKAAIFFLLAGCAPVLFAQNEEIILPEIDTSANKFKPVSYEQIESPPEKFQPETYEYIESPTEEYQPVNYEYIESPGEKYQPAVLPDIDSSAYKYQSGYSAGNGDIGAAKDSVTFYDPLRKITNVPAYNHYAAEEGKIAVDIWVDADGDVVRVQYNAARSDSESTDLINRATSAAKQLHYVARPGAEVEQVTPQVFEFKLK